MATVIDLLRDCQPKLAKGGVVLLWQPWGPRHPEIAEAMDQYGWAVVETINLIRGRGLGGVLGRRRSWGGWERLARGLGL